MKVLVVFSHCRRDSFSGAVLDRLGEGLEAAGHSAEIADLHTEGFDPRFTSGDYAQFSHETMPDDVLAEQARVERNEGLALVFPFFWWGFPAMLKGWIDPGLVRGLGLPLDDRASLRVARRAPARHPRDERDVRAGL